MPCQSCVLSIWLLTNRAACVSARRALRPSCLILTSATVVCILWPPALYVGMSQTPVLKEYFVRAKSRSCRDHARGKARNLGASQKSCSARACRLGGGSIARKECYQDVWRFPLAARAAVCAALQGAHGVRCEVEDLHPVPRAYLEVGTPAMPIAFPGTLRPEPLATISRPCTYTGGRRSACNCCCLNRLRYRASHVWSL